MNTKIINACIFLLLIIVLPTGAQQAQTFFPSNPGFKWKFKTTPLDTLSNPVDSLSAIRIDSFLTIQNYEGKLSNFVASKTGDSTIIDILPFTDTTYIHLETTNGWRFIELMTTLDTLPAIKGWYSYYRFSQTVNSQYTILSRDTTIVIDGTTYPLRLKVTGVRFSDQNVSVPAGIYSSKRFLITNSVNYLVPIPPLPPLEIPLVRIQDSTWIAASIWVVKQFTPSTKLDLTAIGMASIPIPGQKTELLAYIPVGVSDEKIIPADFVLHQNYPNPFNPLTIG